MLDTLGSWLAAGGIVLLVAAFLMIVISCWAMTLFGLPGNWFIPVAAIAFDFALRDGWRLEIQWPLIIVLLLLATVGEGLEFLAGAVGVRRQGGSKLSAVLALIGSALGGVAGAVVGLPIPIVGPVLGVLLFASLGALVGAALGEDWHGEELDKSLSVGVAAFWGRLWGSLAKTLVGGIMVAVVVAGMAI